MPRRFWDSFVLLLLFAACVSAAYAQLPDAPKPQNPQTPKKLPAVLAPQLTRTPMDAADKFRLYLHQAFNPVAPLPPLVGASIRMANPPDHYPREWKDGGGAFGRLYADSLARRETQQAAQLATQIAFREDPRYLPSTSRNAFARTLLMALLEQYDD